MGSGLQRVAKLCGGITVTARGKTVHYDANSKRIAMTPTEQIERLRQLEKAATPGPVAVSWYQFGGDSIPQFETIAEGGIAQDDADYELYCAARNALPALLDIAEAASWLMEDTDDLDRIDKGFEKLDAALSRLGEVK